MFSRRSGRLQPWSHKGAEGQKSALKERDDRLERAKQFPITSDVTNGKKVGKVVRYDEVSGDVVVNVFGSKKEEGWNPDFLEIYVRK